MSTQAEKDVLQKIVEGMDISDEELEFQDAVDVNSSDSREASKKEEDSQKEEVTGTLEMEVTEEKDGVESSSKNKETEASSEKLGDIVESDEGSVKTTELPKHKPTIKVRNDIIDEIFETETNKTVLENTRSRRKKSNESEEASKYMEEETIENIQTLLDTGSEVQKAVSSKKSKEDGEKSETDEVNEPSVFISINSKEDSERFLAEEDGIQNPLESSGPTKPTTTAAIAQDIPQVMLDQLDLKKFPNLKINEKGTTQSTPIAKPDLKKNNTNLLEAIKKRMQLRKEKQKESKIDKDESEEEEEEEGEEKQLGDTPRRGRGRPRKYPPTTPGTEVKATPKSKVETKSKTTEGVQSSKKAPPVKSKPEIKTETEDEEEEEEDMETEQPGGEDQVEIDASQDTKKKGKLRWRKKKVPAGGKDQEEKIVLQPGVVQLKRLQKDTNKKNRKKEARKERLQSTLCTGLDNINFSISGGGGDDYDFATDFK
uniref:Uncharacterized protein n=1 Tax=Cacopsylla melanoneura TaxID=428564 RepID=A0A8D9BB48_9HEMI